MKGRDISSESAWYSVVLVCELLLLLVAHRNVTWMMRNLPIPCHGTMALDIRRWERMWLIAALNEVLISGESSRP